MSDDPDDNIRVTVKTDTGLKLADFHSREDLFNEHKEFSLDPVKVKNSSANQIWECGLQDNSMIIGSIAHYLDLYFPKYFSAFMNTKDDGSMFARLNIGINDDGYITGIPCKGNKISQISDTIVSTIKKLFATKRIIGVVTGDNDNDDEDPTPIDVNAILASMMAGIEVEIIPLDHTNEIAESNVIYTDIENLEKNIKTYEKKRSKYMADMAKYTTDINRWRAQMETYSRKIINVLNDPDVREVFIDFVLTSYSYLCQNNVASSGSTIVTVTDRQNRKINLDFDDHDMLIKLFKDELRRYLGYQKPVKPLRISYDPIVPAIVHLTPLIKQFLNNMVDINYVLISIKIRIANNPNIDVMYSANGQYYRKRRAIKMENGTREPECI
jgi:hypothetical protein